MPVVFYDSNAILDQTIDISELTAPTEDDTGIQPTRNMWFDFSALGTEKTTDSGGTTATTSTTTGAASGTTSSAASGTTSGATSTGSAAALSSNQLDTTTTNRLSYRRAILSSGLSHQSTVEHKDRLHILKLFDASDQEDG